MQEISFRGCKFDGVDPVLTNPAPQEQSRICQVIERDFWRHFGFLEVLNLTEREFVLKLRAITGYPGQNGWPFKGLLYAGYEHARFKRLALSICNPCKNCGLWLSESEVEDYTPGQVSHGFYDYRYCSDQCKQRHINSK